MNTKSNQSYYNPSTVDTDPAETQEWRDALLSLAVTDGPVRVRHILDEHALYQHNCNRRPTGFSR
jgi:pyruvate dehydrogenase E1 component